MRSPAEFARGHVPKAVNIPLLSDEGRHHVGLTYKTEGVAAATSLGVELFATRAQDFMAAVDRVPGRLGVYCWRGGMRSSFVALWLKASGRAVYQIDGGYKAYRTAVVAALDALARRPLIVLDGRTGVGKSAMLRALGANFPAIDFEAIARHRGSAFGDFAQDEAVPTQQNFENETVERLQVLGDAHAVLVEIETFLGPLRLPLSLRSAILASPTVLLERDFDDRVERLAVEYGRGWNLETDRLFLERCEFLARYISRVDLHRIVEATRQRDFRTAAALLLRLRYDPAYDKGLAKRSMNILARFNLSDGEGAALEFLKSQCAPPSVLPSAKAVFQPSQLV